MVHEGFKENRIVCVDRVGIEEGTERRHKDHPGVCVGCRREKRNERQDKSGGAQICQGAQGYQV